jgi:hypothetical protein
MADLPDCADGEHGREIEPISAASETAESARYRMDSGSRITRRPAAPKAAEEKHTARPSSAPYLAVLAAAH